jgi:O-antigen/teichoic acid export membrane protein
MILSVLNILNRRTSFIVFTIMTLSLGLAFSVVIVRFSSAEALGWLNGQLVALGLIAGAAFLYFKRVFGDRLNLGHIKQLINGQNLNPVMVFALPLCLTNFFMWGQNQSYRLIVEKNIGLEFLGMLGLGLSISSNVATAVESIIQQLYYPGYYREISTYDAEQRTHAWNRMAQLVLPIYASLTIMVSCLAPFMVNILASRKFSEAFIFVVYGAWIELFRMTTNLLASVAHAEMQTKYLVKAYFAGGLMAVCGTYFASRWQEYHQFIPLVLVVSGFFTLSVMYVEMKKLARFKIGIRHIRKAVFFSAPFTLALPLYSHSQSLSVSLLVTFTMGTYFLAVQYRLSRVFVADNF